MNWINRAGWVGVMLLVLGSMGSEAPAQSQATSVPGELVVGLNAAAPEGAVQAIGSSVQAYGGQIIERIPQLNVVIVKVSDSSVQSVASAVQSLGSVSYTEANAYFEINVEPNDREWSKQWGPQDINAPQAWDLEEGSKKIVVAVIDSGVDYTHPDLKANYVPTGFDFVEGDDDPFPSGSGRGISHGTHVAGILGASLNNSTGIAGLAQVSVMAVRVLDEKGRGRASAIAKGIVFAADAKANIINLSLGSSQPSKVIEQAVNYAKDKGTLVIAAAGNDGVAKVGFPAGFEAVVAVSATDRNDHLASFSSYGKAVELAAPGVDILSTVPGGRFVNESGTSMASPHAVGVAALVWSLNPELTNEQVRSILCDSAKDLGKSGKDERFGCGRVDALAALKLAQKRRDNKPPAQPPRTTPQGPLTLAVDRGCGPSGSAYGLGEDIAVSFSLDEDATVTLYHLGHTRTLEILAVRSLVAGDTLALPPFKAQHAGVETIVLHAQTDGGRVLTRACSYAVGNARLDAAKLTIDKGCNATYHIGEALTLSLSVKEQSSVSVIDFSTDGNIGEIVTSELAAGESTTISAKVVGPPGIDTLVMLAATPAGVVVTSGCSLSIE